MKRDRREIKKSLGQHYLIDKHLLKKISDLVYKHHPKTIIEIGAGTGLLTQELLLKGGRVHAIEIEKKSLDELEKILSANEALKAVDLGEKLSLQHGDALTISHSKLIENLLKDSLLQSDTEVLQDAKEGTKDKQGTRDKQTTKTERQEKAEENTIEGSSANKQTTEDDQKTKSPTELRQELRQKIKENSIEEESKDKQKAEGATGYQRKIKGRKDLEDKKVTSNQQEVEEESKDKQSTKDHLKIEGSAIEKNSIGDQKNKQTIKNDAKLQQGVEGTKLQQEAKARQEKFPPIAKDFPPTAMAFSPMAICGNLPYNIAARLIVKLLEEIDDLFSTTKEIFLEEQKFHLVFLIQKEVARRMLTPEQKRELKSKEKRSLISYLIAWYGKAKIHFDIKPNSFFPAPKVMSSVIEISINAKPMGEKEDYFFYKKCIKAAFQSRRKTLGNSLMLSLPEYAEALKIFFSKNPMLKKKRADDLTVEEYLKLAACVKENGSDR